MTKFGTLDSTSTPPENAKSGAEAKPADTPPASEEGRGAQWTGVDIVKALTLALHRLRTNRDHLSGLNVFPVPDGDTGTNMTLTLEAGIAALASLSERGAQHAGTVAQCIAHGTLLGARGNSGVILSQVFLGFAQAWSDHETVGVADLIAGLDRARFLAYQAVSKPVEGTMLTVMRLASEKLPPLAETTTIADVLGQAVEAARAALAETPKMLDTLRMAGVVDAGGQGIVYILEALHAYANGEDADTDHLADEVKAPHPLEDSAAAHAAGAVAEEEIGYCTNFAVIGENINLAEARAEISALGTSVVVVGDAKVLKVHLHTDNPGRALEAALRYGALTEIKIDNMQFQAQAIRADTASPAAIAATEAAAEGQPPARQIWGRQSVVAVASGKGLAEALRSLGATHVIDGGDTMNPSTRDLLMAVESALTEEVFILPNHGNVLMTANQIPRLTEKTVHVIPTQSIPQGLAALQAFNADATFEQNRQAMADAFADIHTILMTRAVRDAEIDGVPIMAGQVIGLLDDRLIAASTDELDVLRRAFEAAGLEDVELVTVFVGQNRSPADAQALLAQLDDLLGDVEVEIVDGGQLHYDFMISLE